jgi:hypothetical protein
MQQASRHHAWSRNNSLLGPIPPYPYVSRALTKTEEGDVAVDVVRHVEGASGLVQCDVDRPAARPHLRRLRAIALGVPGPAGCPIDHHYVGVDDARDVHGVSGLSDGHAAADRQAPGRRASDRHSGRGLAAA